tara:strand:+ start:1371 stop:2633 length:1263 start_codon:yes stop_codon:yes gene_type:complete
MSETKAENLFRRQAIQALRQKRPGRPICLMPKPWMWLNGLLLALFIAAAVFLGNIEYARKETVRGWLVSRPAAIRITHNVSASIDKIVRGPGEHVVAGEVLVYLSNNSIGADGTSKDEQLLRQLRQDVVELEAQLQLSQQRLHINDNSLKTQMHDIDREIASIEQQIQEQQRSMGVGNDQLSRIASAAQKGAVSDWSLMQQRRDQLGLQQELSTLQQKLAGLRRSRESMYGRQAALPLEFRIEQSDLRVQRSRLTQQIAELETRRLSVLTSPVSGTVTSIDAHTGNRVAAGQLLLTVLPDDVELDAELYVPSRAAGLIRTGQQVRLQYDAFPYQEFGAFPGRIAHISEIISLPADLPHPFPLQEVSYKVRVQISNTRIRTELGNASLRPGMLLVAEIVLENRRLIDWLLDSLRWRRRVPT